MKNKNLVWIVAGVLIVGIVASLVYFNDSKEEEVIKVGAVLPLTGLFSENGENSLRGYELAIEEINNEGGIDGKKIEIIIESHKGDDTVGAVNAYQSLILKGIKIILGPNHSPTGLAVAPMACRDEALLISPSLGTAEFAPTCETIFNAWPADSANSKKLGSKIVNMGYERIVIIGSTQSWEDEQARVVKMGVEESGGNVVKYVITDNSNIISLTDVTKILSSSPDAIVFTNYGYMHLYAKKIREFESNAQFFVVVLDETRKDMGEGAFEGAIVISSYTPTAWFKEKYRDKYGVEPDYPADSSYDALMVLSKAIEETKTIDPVTLSKQILTYQNYDGASGTFSFLHTGDVSKKSIFQIVIDNKIEIFDIYNEN